MRIVAVRRRGKRFVSRRSAGSRIRRRISIASSKPRPRRQRKEVWLTRQRRLAHAVTNCKSYSDSTIPVNTFERRKMTLLIPCASCTAIVYN